MLTTKEYRLLRKGREKGYVTHADALEVYADRNYAKAKLRRLGELGYLRPNRSVFELTPNCNRLWLGTNASIF